MGAATTAEELKQNVDRLNYFCYLLSHPEATISARPRLRSEARQAEPADPDVAVLEPEGHLAGWSPTLSKL